jgi:tetratricopeptide (TPR) repeat protein
MRLFTTPQVICLSFVLALSLQVTSATNSPCNAAVKSKKGANAKATKKAAAPLSNMGQATHPLDLEGIAVNLEQRMNVQWRPMSIGKTAYCEVHFLLMSNGNVENSSIYRQSGSVNYDQACKNCVDQSGRYAPYEGIDQLEVIATFKTEAKGADVTVRFPGYQGVDSKVDKEIAYKRKQLLNTIDVMKQRISGAQKVVGTDSPKLAVSINFLANTYTQVKDYTAAEAAFKWVITIRQKANGPSSRELAESLSDLGEMYRLKGDYVSAEEYFKRVLNMPGMKPCIETREAMHRYATMCLADKRKADADFLFNRVNQIQAGAPLDPIPANLQTEPSTTAATDGKDGAASDTKAGEKSAADAKASDKPAAAADAKPDSPKKADDKDAKKE